MLEKIFFFLSFLVQTTLHLKLERQSIMCVWPYNIILFFFSVPNGITHRLPIGRSVAIRSQRINGYKNQRAEVLWAIKLRSIQWPKMVPWSIKWNNVSLSKTFFLKKNISTTQGLFCKFKSQKCPNPSVFFEIRHSRPWPPMFSLEKAPSPSILFPKHP